MTASDVLPIHFPNLILNQPCDCDVSIIELPLVLDQFLICFASEQRHPCFLWSLAILHLMIAPSTLYISSFHLIFVLYFLQNKLSLLLFTSGFSSYQLDLLSLATLVPMTLVLDVLFIFMELAGVEVHVEECFLHLDWSELRYLQCPMAWRR